MDILAALDQLEEAEKPKTSSKVVTKDIAARNAAKNAGPRPLSSRAPSTKSRRTSGASEKNSKTAISGRPQSQPPPARYLQTPEPQEDRVRSSARSERSPSQGPDSRRISFADPPRPSGNKIWIATRTDSLASGFDYDPRLNKYNVSEAEWEHFCTELVEAANVPGPSWMWSFKKKDVMKRLNRELQYDGDVKKVFKKWNRLFKQQRFQAWLELPGEKSDDLEGNDIHEKVNVKRFRVVITPNSERAPSVYSRSSSLTRSVTGEGATAALAHKQASDEMQREDGDAEQAGS